MTDDPLKHPKVQQALADLPPGLRPELLHGIALWQNGYSKSEAAAVAGVPRRTLVDAIGRLPPDIAREELEEHVAPVSIAVANEGMRQVYEDLTNPDVKLSTMQKVTIAGIATDKAVAIQRIQRPEGGGIEAVLQRLHDQGGGKVTLEVEPHRTVDVTPEREQP